MRQLGGDVVTLINENIQSVEERPMQIRQESYQGNVDALMVRTDDSKKLDELVSYSTVPVINDIPIQLTQIMADIMTFEEHKGSIQDKTIAWTGDGNNVANTLIHAAVQFNFILHLACPSILGPNEDILKWGEEHGGRIKLTSDPYKAVKDADCIITDTWVSMHNTEGERVKALAP